MAAQSQISPNVSLVGRTVALDEGCRIDAQRVGFWLCCAYVLSQIYMVPVWLIGPSWSVWPTLTDLVIPLMLICLPFVRSGRGSGRSELASVRHCLLVLVCGSVLSYFALTLNLFDIKAVDVLNEKGPSVGLFQIYRLGQFLIVFLLASRIDLNASRRRWLRRVIGVTFWVSCALLLANYFDWIDTPALGPQIPTDLGSAGPWAFYSRGVVGSPVGAISFHRAYPAVQLLLLAASYLYLLGNSRVWLPSLVQISLWVCGLVSGSRAGFIAVCVFVAATAFPRLRRLFVIGALVATSAVAWISLPGGSEEGFSKAIARQESIATSYEEDGLAGRVGIWNDRLSLLDQSPLLWLFGTGFGSAVETGSNGHMLFLQTTLECGLVGTMVFIFTICRICLLLWRRGGQARTLFLATAALLVSALTQETFYPVPALGHFCGMYLFCLGIAFCTPTSAYLSRPVT